MQLPLMRQLGCGSVAQAMLGTLLALPLLACAGPNQPHAPTLLPEANPVSGLAVTGQQVSSPDKSCTSVHVRVTGTVLGVNDDDGYGQDFLTFELWDEGELRDAKTLQIPIMASVPIDVTLQFIGRYRSGAVGVGVYAHEIGLVSDPFVPVKVTGPCAYTLPITGQVRDVRKVTTTCTNLTTGQEVRLSGSSFDCAAAGLKYTPRDKVNITINGLAR